MTIVVSSSKHEKVFDEKKDVINIGTNPNCDFKLDLDFDILISVQYDEKEGKCVLMNTFHSERVLFKGKPFRKIEIGNICKIMFTDSPEFINIKVLDAVPAGKNLAALQQPILTEEDMKELYGDDANAATRIKLDKQKADIEGVRVAIIKEVAFQINDLKNKISSNTKTNIFLHVAMAMSSIFCSFAVANYIMGLSIKESANYLHLPTNIKVWVAVTIAIFGLAVTLKQGVYMFLQSAENKGISPLVRFSTGAMVCLPLIFMLVIYVINLAYYMNIADFTTFAIIISLFFSGMLAALALGSGYFKHTSGEWLLALNKYEFREDFEAVVKAYRLWIDRYLNTFSNSKIEKLKDKIFGLQLKGLGEAVLGICTAPALAYGVSNTLAMCFPEAAGWMRIEGFRFSPMFWFLASLMIVFAFFAFVSSFTTAKKIQGSHVIKQDGYSDHRQHGVTIYGLEGTRKLNSDKTKMLYVGCAIIFIEFVMNVSYFMSEIGGDLMGLVTSFLAAFVPTAILIAETMMLSNTTFELHACEEVLARIDKD